MSLKTFEVVIKRFSRGGWELSRKDVSELKEKHNIKDSIKNEKAENLLEKYGYKKLMWIEYRKRVDKILGH